MSHAAGVSVRWVILTLAYLGRYLEFFLEDDAELAQIRAAYVSGKLLSGEMKARAIACIQVSSHRATCLPHVR
eukprot:1927005-Rhodomonas_salina.1